MYAWLSRHNYETRKSDFDLRAAQRAPRMIRITPPRNKVVECS